MRLAILSLVLCFGFGLNAQTDSSLAKKWLVGGNAEMYMEKIGSNSGRVIAILEPQVGYFFTNYLAAGLRVPLSFKSNEYQISIQPFVRFYLPTESMIRPFLEVNTGYDWRVIIPVTSTPNNVERSWLFGARGGAAFFLNKSVSIDMFLFYSGVSSKSEIGTTGEISDPLLKQYLGLGAGFQVYLGR